MDSEPREATAELGSMWERVRAEERADRLSQVVQDTVRDARVADVLAARVAPRSA